MDFEPNDVERAVQETARRFAREVLVPVMGGAELKFQMGAYSTSLLTLSLCVVVRSCQTGQGLLSLFLCPQKRWRRR